MCITSLSYFLSMSPLFLFFFICFVYSAPLHSVCTFSVPERMQKLLLAIELVVGFELISALLLTF